MLHGPGRSAIAPDLGHEPPAWFADALCTQFDPEMFWPEKGASPSAPKSVCASCPVRAECLAFGLAEPEGVYGGLSGRERRKLRATGWQPGDPLPEVVGIPGRCDDCGRKCRDLTRHRKSHAAGAA